MTYGDTSTERRPRIRSSRVQPKSGLVRICWHARLISRKYFSAVLTEASTAKYRQMSNKSCSASGDQTAARLRLGMPPAGPLDNLLYIELPSGPSVERSDTLREVGSKAAELFDVSEQLAPDPLLSLFGKSLDLSNGKLQAVHNVSASRPNLLQVSDISLSVANSPRSASAIDSLMSAIRSIVSRYRGSFLAILSKSCPAMSWRSSGNARTAS